MPKYPLHKPHPPVLNRDFIPVKLTNNGDDTLQRMHGKTSEKPPRIIEHLVSGPSLYHK